MVYYNFELLTLNVVYSLSVITIVKHVLSSVTFSKSKKPKNILVFLLYCVCILLLNCFMFKNKRLETATRASVHN